MPCPFDAAFLFFAAMPAIFCHGADRAQSRHDHAMPPRVRAERGCRARADMRDLLRDVPITPRSTDSMRYAALCCAHANHARSRLLPPAHVVRQPFIEHAACYRRGRKPSREAAMPAADSHVGCGSLTIRAAEAPPPSAGRYTDCHASSQTRRALYTRITPSVTSVVASSNAAPRFLRPPALHDACRHVWLSIVRL